MALLEIRRYPDPGLQKKAEPIKDLDPSLKTLIEDMIETMYHAPGIGLAATQVGKPVRVIVFDLHPREEGRNPSCLINPEIVETEGEQILEEGCLSVPEYFSEVKRNAKVKVRGLDPGGKPVEICGEGVLATVLQHEIDHLDGILFIDRISALKRALYKKRVQKKLKQKSEAD
jgi:peptide deformylase